MAWRDVSSVRNLAIFLCAIAACVLAPSVVRHFVDGLFEEFRAPIDAIPSQLNDLGKYWSLHSNSKRSLIEAGRDLARINSAYELKMLENAVDISRQTTKLVRSAYLPQVALTGGYLVTNPSLYNGFERKFSGIWNIGVMVRIPVWNWFESTYKIRASKTATSIAQLELDDAREKVELQVSQSSFKVAEANKKLALAEKSTEQADENLRCANLGFKEGVMDVTDVMAAQTAWLQARSQKIDADIDVRLTMTNLRKVLGETIY